MATTTTVYQQGYVQPVVAAPAGIVVTQTTQRSSMREAIPSLPMPLAVIYAILNFFIPGFGTILAGFSVLCCGNVGQSGASRVGTFCINFWVGLLQLLICWTIVGWVWSIIWGVALISSAASDGETTTTTTAVVAPVVQPVVSYETTTTTFHNQGTLPGYGMA